MLLTEQVSAQTVEGSAEPIAPPSSYIDRSRLTYPFNEESVIDSFFDLGEQIIGQAADYDLVVGEDTSGRLPALFIKGILDAERSRLGLTPTEMRFNSGRRSEPIPRGHYPKPKTRHSRALIVTEFIVSGGSVRTVYDGLSGFWSPDSIDIASAGGLDVGAQKVKAFLRKGSRLYMVPDDKIDDHLYRLGSQKGVSKEYGDAFSHRGTRYDGRSVVEARSNVKLLINEFTERRLSELQPIAHNKNYTETGLTAKQVGTRGLLKYLKLRKDK